MCFYNIEITFSQVFTNTITNETTNNTNLAIEKKQEMPHNNYRTYLQQLPQDVTKKIRQLEANRKKEINCMYGDNFNKILYTYAIIISCINSY